MIASGNSEASLWLEKVNALFSAGAHDKGPCEMKWDIWLLILLIA